MGIHIARYAAEITPDRGELQIDIEFMGRHNNEEELLKLYRKIKDLVETENNKTG